MSRPKVVVCQQASVDGRLAVSPEQLLLYGDKRWEAIGGACDFDVFEWLRSTHDVQATLEGSGSLVREGDEPGALPPLTGDAADLYEDYLPEAVTQRPGHRGWFTIVDGRGRCRQLIKDGGVFGEAWEGWHLLVLAGYHTPAEYLAYLRDEEIPYLVAGQGAVDLRSALEKMGSSLGVTSLLSMAGGQLNGALLRANLIDEISVEFLPAAIGGRETPSLFDAPSLAPDEWPVRLDLISAQVQAGGCVWLRYRVVPGWEFLTRDDT
jgi:riboflavin biosynthesis pyrimidine reductase